MKHKNTVITVFVLILILILGGTILNSYRLLREEKLLTEHFMTLVGASCFTFENPENINGELLQFSLRKNQEKPLPLIGTLLEKEIKNVRFFIWDLDASKMGVSILKQNKNGSVTVVRERIDNPYFDSSLRRETVPVFKTFRIEPGKTESLMEMKTVKKTSTEETVWNFLVEAESSVD